MAHCPYDRLTDIEDVLETIRAWAEIKEPRPGIFYLRRTPFLHFHVAGDRRWADIRAGDDWGPPVEILAPASAAAKRRFLSAAAQRHRTMQATLQPARGLSKRAVRG